LQGRPQRLKHGFESCRSTVIPIPQSRERNLALILSSIETPWYALIPVPARCRARFLAEFTLSGQSEILLPRLRDQDDSEGLGMTSARFGSFAAGFLNRHGRLDIRDFRPRQKLFPAASLGGRRSFICAHDRSEGRVRVVTSSPRHRHFPHKARVDKQVRKAVGFSALYPARGDHRFGAP